LKRQTEIKREIERKERDVEEGEGEDSTFTFDYFFWIIKR
jgi:hypothetical protein